MAARGALTEDRQLEYVLAGGDDYELAFTAPASRRDAVRAAALEARTPVTRIGRIESEPGLRLVDGKGGLLDRHYGSFDHFA
jgi:thiamine-monophosphate kinase